jgi:ribosomal-protein-alanine N-acetyltransferase
MIDVREVLTPRLRLRSTTAADGPWHRLLDGNPVVTATLGGSRTDDETEAYVAAQASHWAEHGFGWWTVFDRETDEFVGRGGLRRIVLEGSDEVEVGYALIPQCWGMGLATELATVAVSLGADVLGLERIIGVTLPTNHASPRVLEKAGLTYEGMTEYHDLPHRLYVWARQPEA